MFIECESSEQPRTAKSMPLFDLIRNRKRNIKEKKELGFTKEVVIKEQMRC